MPAQAAVSVKKEALSKKTTKKVASKPLPKKKAKAVKVKDKKAIKSSAKKTTAKKTVNKPLSKKAAAAAKAAKGKKKIKPIKSRRSTGGAWSFDTMSEEAVVSDEALAKAAERKGRFEIGGRAGLFASTTGIFGEVRFPLLRMVGLATTSVRLSGGFAQEEEGFRRYVPVCLDGMLNFPAGYITGVENYLGGGVNYVALTSGRVPGAFGGQVFYGVEGSGFGGKLFGEVGYGFMRTGFSAAQKGLSLMVGYRK